MLTREPANEQLDPDGLLAAVIECIADGLPNRDAEVIEFK
jgi:hypothetical protein